MKKIALLISTVSVLAIASPAKALYNFTASSGGVDPTGTLISGSDVANGIVTISAPFNFSLYSTNVTVGQTITISTEGNIQFVASGGNNLASNVQLRAGTMPNAPVVFAYWDNSNLNIPGGGIYTNTSGTVGSRVFDIEWRGRHNGDGGTAQTLNFEVRFFENSNTFQISYGQTGVATNATAQNGASATVGIQAGNTAPSAFTQYSFNQALITSGLSLTAATPIPFTFSPMTAFAFIGANIARRRAKAKSAKLMQSAESV